MNSPQVYELIGQIKWKIRNRVYIGKHAGRFYYRLDCQIENKDGIKEIFAFWEMVWKDSLWQTIETMEEEQYANKRYLFFCIRRRGKFALTDWRELSNNHEKKTN
jgi:hypothetical protein